MDINELAKRNDDKGRLLSKKKLKERLEEFILVRRPPPLGGGLTIEHTKIGK